MGKFLISRAYMPALYDQSRYLLLYGGAGSGKSEFVARKIVYRLITEKQNHKIAIIRKYRRTNRLSTVEVIKSVLDDLGIYYKFNKTELDIETTINGRKHYIYFLGLDDSEKLKSIKGITSVWIEETTEIKKEDFIQVDLRLREPTKTYKQIMMTFNPVLSKARWLYEMFFEREHEDTFILRTTIFDNPVKEVREQYLKVLESIDDPVYKKIYLEGLWAELGNLIYPNYTVIPEFPTLPRSQRAYGLDFGYNNPSVLVEVGFAYNTIYIQQLLYESHLTPSQLIAKIKELNIDKDIPIFADIDPGVVAEMRTAGLNVVTKKPTSVFESIMKIKRYKIAITDDSPDVLKEIQEYKWKETRDGLVLDEPVKFMDHAMDAFRYAFCGRWGMTLQGKVVTKVGRRAKKSW